MEHPLLKKEVTFCPDLDRGAIFSVEEVAQTKTQEEVIVTIKWLRGRWSPPSSSTGVFKLRAPKNFTEIDLGDRWYWALVV